MIRYICWIATLLFLLLVLTDGNVDNHELALMRKLFDNYDVNVRPVETYSDAVIVTFHLAILQILDMDEIHQLLSVNFLIAMYWQDAYLQWDPADHGGIKDIRVFGNRIWRPDIVLVHDISHTREPVEKLFLAVIRYNGSITWSFPIQYEMVCKLDMTYYPFDKQNCLMNFTSWIHPARHIDVNTSGNSADLEYYVPHGEWVLKKFSALVYSEGYLGESYTELSYNLEIDRKPLFLFYNLILPSILLTFCTFLVFLLPPESGEKVSMSVTMLLSTTVFLLLVAEFTPAQSDSIPVIGKYFGCAVLLLVLSTAATVIVLNIHFHGVLRLQISPWPKKIILGWLATCMFMRKSVDCILKDAMKHQHQVKPENIPSETQVAEFDDVSHSTAPKGSKHVLYVREYALDPTYMEWVLTAMVLDRLFFCIFMVVTAIVTLALMTDHPD